MKTFDLKDWIKVTDRLPELTQHSYWHGNDGRRQILFKNDKATVLGFDPKRGIIKAEYSQRGWSEVSTNSISSCVNIIKWMPLPPVPMTRKETILLILKNPCTKLTCAEICERIIEIHSLTGSVAHYLSGSVSSILNKLVKAKILKYSTKVGPRGGYVYQTNYKTKKIIK